MLTIAINGNAAERTGELIYRQQCAKCHGERGEGTKKYDEALIGDWPLTKLTAEIEKTMPDGKPKLCVGEDAVKVAKYIYDTFYSPMSKARNQPTRVMFRHSKMKWRKQIYNGE